MPVKGYQAISSTVIGLVKFGMVQVCQVLNAHPNGTKKEKFGRYINYSHGRSLLAVLYIVFVWSPRSVVPPW
jgi:hypothetical protein